MLHLSRGGRRLLAFVTAMLVAIGLLAGLSAVSFAHAAKAHQSHRAHWSHGGSITSVPWGTADGQAVSLYTLTNGRGMSVAITNYGGVVQSISVPDRWGSTKDVALGFSTLQDYVSDFTQGATGVAWPIPGASGSGDTYFGAIIGRYANRIANHSFTMTCSAPCTNNGQTYTLDANNGVNTLHGGFLGWNTAVWTATTQTGPNGPSLILTNTFPSGEGCLTLSATCNGFPASVKATVTYTLTRNDALQIQYNAVNQSSTLATVINLTNHTYFNLGGEGSGSVFDQELQINANQYQPVDTNLIPTNFASVAGTAYDFRYLHRIGLLIHRADLPDGGTQPYPQLVIAHGYDNNWVLNGSGYRLASVALDPKTGIELSTFTDQPGVQFYSGNFLVGDLVGPSGHTYRQTDGFTLETQHYPDAPHHIGQAGWPSVVLNPSGTFTSETTYAFSTAGHGHDAHDRR
jgi:aldose 1-epimerase